MSKKKHDRDPLDTDDPGHPDFPVAEGADVVAAEEAPPAASTRHTPNELMFEWWKLIRQSTPDPASVGDHFIAFAAAEGYQLTEIEPPPPEEPA